MLTQLTQSVHVGDHVLQWTLSDDFKLTGLSLHGCQIVSVGFDAFDDHLTRSVSVTMPCCTQHISVAPS